MPLVVEMPLNHFLLCRDSLLVLCMVSQLYNYHRGFLGYGMTYLLKILNYLQEGFHILLHSPHRILGQFQSFLLSLELDFLTQYKCLKRMERFRIPSLVRVFMALPFGLKVILSNPPISIQFLKF